MGGCTNNEYKEERNELPASTHQAIFYILSTIGKSNYHFGVKYAGTKQLSPTEAFHLLVGDMDSSGSLNAQVIRQLGPGVRSKLAIATQQSKFVNWQLDEEY